MKYFCTSIVALVLLLNVLSFQAKAQMVGAPPPPAVQPPVPNEACRIPLLFTNRPTSYRFPDSSSQCQTRCVRRSVRTWSEADWKLYGDLWNEANSRGWIEDLRVGHSIDNCTQNPLTGPHFHLNETFLSWHRFFIAHYEQLFQQIDHEIFPGQAAERGEFCLGYFDWGYKEEYNSDLRNRVYNYIFGPRSIGTLRSGSNPVPDGAWANVRVGPRVLLRDPGVGNTSTPNTPFTPNSWNSIVISACLSIQDMVGVRVPGEEADINNPPRFSFHQCVEDLPHSAIHQAIGGDTGQMGNLDLSSSDPVFFLHHTMVDYVWWVWQSYADKTYPASWDSQFVPPPYNLWRNQDTKDYQRFCYDYQPNDNTTRARARYNRNRLAPTEFDQLDPIDQQSVEDVINQGQPGVIPREQFTFLRSMANNEGQFEQAYNDYLVYVQLAQRRHAAIVRQYRDSYQRVRGVTVNVQVSEEGNGTSTIQARSNVATSPSTTAASTDDATYNTETLSYLSGSNSN